ncbi:MAG: hypothetical protein ACK58T_49540, partial [Phycisphaerae bacterium]
MMHHHALDGFVDFPSTDEVRKETDVDGLYVTRVIVEGWASPIHCADNTVDLILVPTPVPQVLDQLSAKEL